MIKKYALILGLFPFFSNAQFGTEVPVEGAGGPEQDSIRCGSDPSIANCDEALEFDESNNKVFHAKTGKPFTGKCESCHENGQRRHLAVFVDGKESGTSYSYHPDGAIHTKRSFTNGVENGVWEFYDPAKRNAEGDIVVPVSLRWQFTYVDGKKNGNCIWYFPGGGTMPNDTSKMISYKMGKPDGPTIKYYEPKKIKSIIHFSEGRYDGPYKTYYKNGQISIDKNYKNMELDGPIKHYYEDGQISMEGEYKMGVKDGKWVHYFKNGVEKSVAYYNNGVKDGQFVEHYEEDGKVKSERLYENNYLMSEFLWDEFGNPIDEEGHKLTKEEAQERDKIVRATGEAQRDNKGKGKKANSVDLSAIDQELMCGCIKAEMAGEKPSEECEEAKKKFRTDMEKADKKTKKKMSKMISECEKQ